MIQPGQTKVLAITKRTAQLCATQSELHMNGIELVTATSLAMVAVVLKSLDVKGVIVCKSSWSEQERENIVKEVSALRPGTALIMRCLGCTGCNEAAGIAGMLNDTAPLTQLILAIEAAEA